MKHSRNDRVRLELVLLGLSLNVDHFLQLYMKLYPAVVPWAWTVWYGETMEDGAMLVWSAWGKSYCQAPTVRKMPVMLGSIETS